MLEQRRAQEKGYITLKEAAQLSGYSPDYIGQLIRQGKISGKQIYFNVAWVTTEDEIYRYLQEKKNKRKGKFSYWKLIREFYNRSQYRMRAAISSVSPFVLFKSFVYSLLLIVAAFSLLLFWHGIGDGSANLTSKQLQVSRYDNQKVTMPILP